MNKLFCCIVFIFIPQLACPPQNLFAGDDCSPLTQQESKKFSVFNSKISSLKNGIRCPVPNINDLVYSPDNRFLVSSQSGIKIWDAHTLEQKGTISGHRIAGHSIGTTDIDISPNSKTLVSVAENDTIHIWDLKSRSLKLKIDEVKRLYYDVAILPSGNSFIVGSSGKFDDSFLWGFIKRMFLRPRDVLEQRDMKTGDILNDYIGHRFSADAIKLSPDGKTFATSSFDGSVRIWDIQSGKQNKIVFERDNELNANHSLSYSKDGKKLAFGYSETFYNKDKDGKILDFYSKKKLYIIDLETLETIVSLEFPSSDIEFILNDKYIMGYNAGRFEIWDMDDYKPELIVKRKELGGYIEDHAISPDGKVLALGLNQDKSKKVYILLIELG